MDRQLKSSDINHLRRLLGWVRCEIGQTPEEVIALYKNIAQSLGIDSERARAAIAESLVHSHSVPKYIRAAVKALEKHVREAEGDTVNGENVSGSRLERKPELIEDANAPRR